MATVICFLAIFIFSNSFFENEPGNHETSVKKFDKKSGLGYTKAERDSFGASAPLLKGA